MLFDLHEMRMFFRSMTPDSDGLPKVAASARGLGARPEDLVPDEKGVAHPSKDGMSVAPDDWRNLPAHRRPRTFGHGSSGKPEDRVYLIVQSRLNVKGLDVRVDKPKHGLVELSC